MSKQAKPFEGNSYRVLNALPAETFLHPGFFRTPFDTPKLDEIKYQDGLRQGAESVEVSVGVYGTWGAVLKAGGTLTSSEGIGYHASTGAFLRGLIHSGVKIVIHRYIPESVDGKGKRIPGKFTETVIQPSGSSSTIRL